MMVAQEDELKKQKQRFQNRGNVVVHHSFSVLRKPVPLRTGQVVDSTNSSSFNFGFVTELITFF